MNQLVELHTTSERITVSARELHFFLESNERFSKWFERMTTYGFESSVDYTQYQKVHPQNYQEITDYQLTIDCAKQIPMLQRNEKGTQARKYFLEVEKAWNSPEKIMARALEFANKEINTLQIEVKEMKPKALFADSVSASRTSILIGELAKILNQNGLDIGQNRLFEDLRCEGYLIRRRGTDYNMPTQKSMDLVLMEIKERAINNPNGPNKITKTPKITGKGQVYFVNRYLNN